MVAGANVASVEAIEELSVALTRFGADAMSALDQMERQIRRARDWLAERKTHWQRENERRNEVARHAQAELRACASSGDRDHPPDCRTEEEALRVAIARLREAEEELRNVLRWAAAFEQRTAEYQRQALRMRQQIEQQIPKAKATLGQAIASLDAYLGVSAPSSAALTSAADHARSTVIVGRVTDTAASFASIGLAVTAVAIAGAMNRRSPARSSVHAAESPPANRWSDFHDVPTSACPTDFSRVAVSADGRTVVLEPLHESDAGHTTAASVATAVAALSAVAVIAIVLNPRHGSHIIYRRDPVTGQWSEGETESTPDLTPMPGSAVETLPNETHHVRLDQIDLSDARIQNEDDFEDGRYARTLDMLLTLQHTILPAVERGMDADYFSTMDTDLNLDYDWGYRGIYDAFFGNDAILLDWNGDRYNVTGGEHRLFIARQLSWLTIPAQVRYSIDTRHYDKELS